MKDTGGPAFPSLHAVRYHPHFHIEEGMTLPHLPIEETPPEPWRGLAEEPK